MKKLILETPESSGNNYQLYAEMKPSGTGYHIKFTTVWSGARDPHGEQNKFEMFLNKASIDTLKELLEGAE